MDFSQALYEIKTGNAVARIAWGKSHGGGVYLCIYENNKRTHNTILLEDIFADDWYVKAV